MAGVLGGDLVGMSTALETIAAREAGLEVLGISLVTNLAAGISPDAAEPPARCWRPGARRRRGCARCSAGIAAAPVSEPLRPPSCCAASPRWTEQDPDPQTRQRVTDLLDRGRRRAASRRSAELTDAFTGRLEFGTAGLRGALGPGPEPDEPGGRRPGGGRAGHLPARPGAGRRAGDHRLRRPAQLRRLRPRHRRDHGRRRLRRDGHRRPAAHPGGRLRHPALRLRGRRGGHRLAQPAAGQRLQGLPGRRLADRAAGRRRDRRADRRGGHARDWRDVPRVDGLHHARATSWSRPTWTGSPRLVPAGRAARRRLGLHPAARRRRVAGRAGRGRAPASRPRAVVAEQAEPDPDFPTVAFPNPEEPGAIDLALARAERGRRRPGGRQRPGRRPVRGGRRWSTGAWRMLRGDELGALLGDDALRRGRTRARTPARSSPARCWRRWPRRTGSRSRTP